MFLACHETRKSSEESSRSESKHAGGGKGKRTTTVGTWLQVCLAASGGGPLLRTNGSVSPLSPSFFSPFPASSLPVHGPLPPAATHRVYVEEEKEKEGERRVVVCREPGSCGCVHRACVSAC